MSPRLRRGVLLTSFVLLGLCAAGFDASTQAVGSGKAAPGGQYRPALAFDGTNMLVVWEDIRFSESIAGARVSPEGIVLDPEEIRIAIAPNSQDEPDVAFGGDNYLVAWQDERSTGYRDIYARQSHSGRNPARPGRDPHLDRRLLSLLARPGIRRRQLPRGLGAPGRHDRHSWHTGELRRRRARRDGSPHLHRRRLAMGPGSCL